MSRLLEQLRKYKDNRGMMANLRCILVDNKKHRAWPVLNRLEVEINNGVAAFVAGLFATHPEGEEMATGNFGTTCRAIKRKRDDNTSDDSKLTPIERRFQHLLAAEAGDELHKRILRMVLMAKAEGVPVNYAKLEADLRNENDVRKTKWAVAFWSHIASSVPEEAI